MDDDHAEPIKDTRNSTSVTRALVRALSYSYSYTPMRQTTSLAIRRDGSDLEWGLSVAAMPLMGATLGAVLGGLTLGGFKIWSRPVAILVCWLVAVVNCLPKLDSVADFADGFAMRRNAKRTLEIMNDPRIGAIGAAVMVAVLVGELISLEELAPGRLVVGLGIASMLSKWGSVVHIYRSPAAAGDSRRIARFTRSCTTPLFVVSSALTAAASVALAGTLGAIAFGMVGVAMLGFRRLVVARLDGINGDTIGAADRFALLIALLVLCSR